MAELNTWYNQVSAHKNQPELLYQLDIRLRPPINNRLTIILASYMDAITISASFGDAEKWARVEKVKNPVTDKKISKGKPFVIKEIFSMAGLG